MDTIAMGIEKRARGRVVAQQRYLERQRLRKSAEVERIVGRVEDFLRTEVKLTNLIKPGLSKAQRRRIYAEICRRSKAVLLG